MSSSVKASITMFLFTDIIWGSEEEVDSDMILSGFIVPFESRKIL
jgi:hypothetical protein